MSFDKVLCIEDIFITFMNIRNSAHRVVYELLFNESFSHKTFLNLEYFYQIDWFCYTLSYSCFKNNAQK